MTDHRKARSEAEQIVGLAESLKASAQALLEVMTFDQVVQAVAESFPPGRRISRSALHRWWHRRGKHILRGHAKPRNIR